MSRPQVGRYGFTSNIPDTVKATDIHVPPGRILVQLLKSKYQGNIVIPDTAKLDNSTVGRVVGVGQCPRDGKPVGKYAGCDERGNPLYEVMPWQEDDILFFGKFVGAEFVLGDGFKYKILYAWEDVYGRFDASVAEEILEATEPAGAGDEV